MAASTKASARAPGASTRAPLRAGNGSAGCPSRAITWTSWPSNLIARTERCEPLIKRSRSRSPAVAESSNEVRPLRVKSGVVPSGARPGGSAVPSGRRRHSSINRTSSRSTATRFVSPAMIGSGRAGSFRPSSKRRKSAARVPAFGIETIEVSVTSGAVGVRPRNGSAPAGPFRPYQTGASGTGRSFRKTTSQRSPRLRRTFPIWLTAASSQIGVAG